MWTRKCQDVSHLRLFGCIAYAKIAPDIAQLKLLPHSIKYRIVGYFGRSTYKLYDPAMCSIIKCHNVIFDEGQGHRTLLFNFNDVLVSESPDVPAAVLHSTTSVLRPNIQTVLAACSCITDPPLHPTQLNAARPRPIVGPDTPIATPQPVPVYYSTHITQLTQAIKASQ